MTFSDQAYDDQLAQLRAAVREARQMVSQSHAALQRNGRLMGHAAPAIDTGRAFAHFDELLQSGAIRDALAYLAGLTDYRYLSIFRFHDGRARSVVHVDTQLPDVHEAAEVPDTATYCRYIRDTDKPFVTVAAAGDARTEGHPARDAVPAYCGVPIYTPEGTFIGTLCHWDLVPRDPEHLDFELLLQASSALARSGRVPGYPGA